MQIKNSIKSFILAVGRLLLPEPKVKPDVPDLPDVSSESTASALSRDWQNVGNDLAGAIRKYEEHLPEEKKEEVRRYLEEAY